jgi:GTP-binding protein
MTQPDTGPPFFMISANQGRCLAEAYEKYLMRRIRTRWGLRGVPIRLVVRAKNRGKDT